MMQFTNTYKLKVSFLIITLLTHIFLLNCSKMVIRDEVLNKASFPNWTQYGGNAQRTNAYPLSVSLPLKLIRQHKTNTAIEKTLIVVDGILYFATMDGEVHAILISTGEDIGHKKLDISSTICYNNHHLIIARRYGDDTLYDLDLHSNKYLWRINAGDINSEPLLTSEGIIITALYNHIDLYSIDSGKKLWSYDTQDQVRSSPAAAFGIVVFGCDDGFVYALQTTSGEMIWKFKTGASVQSIPAIDSEDKIVYFGSSDKNFYALHLEDGKETWRFKTNGQILNGAAISGERIIFGSTDRNIYCLNKKNGKLLWKATAKSVVSTSPLIAGNMVFWGSLDHFFYAAAVNNGELIWQFKANGRVRTTPVVWGDYFICASENNYLYFFKPGGK